MTESVVEPGITTIKALTLHQPWASLVALGAKTIETRSWRTDYRGPLAIHAGARQVHSGQFLLLARLARKAGSIDGDVERRFRALAVPFGAVVATCELADVVPTESIWWEASGWEHPRAWRQTGRPVRSVVEWDHTEVEPSQRPFGDFSSGRFAWLLADVKPLDEPVPARGLQGLWDWERSDSDRRS